jgi:hypothetical protein
VLDRPEVGVEFVNERDAGRKSTRGFRLGHLRGDRFLPEREETLAGVLRNFAATLRLGAAFVRQIDIVPAGETVFFTPDASAVTDENKFALVQVVANVVVHVYTNATSKMASGSLFPTT